MKFVMESDALVDGAGTQYGARRSRCSGEEFMMPRAPLAGQMNGPGSAVFDVSKGSIDDIAYSLNSAWLGLFV